MWSTYANLMSLCALNSPTLNILLVVMDQGGNLVKFRHSHVFRRDIWEIFRALGFGIVDSDSRTKWRTSYIGHYVWRNLDIACNSKIQCLANFPEVSARNVAMSKFPLYSLTTKKCWSARISSALDLNSNLDTIH